MTELAVQERGGKKPASLRAAGLLPGVFYGPKEESQPIALDAKIFEKLWREVGSSSIIVLKGLGEDKEVLIHDVDVHPVTEHPQHVDFYVIERGKKIEVSVPLEFIGEAPAEKAGGVVVKVLHEVEISVRPSELPQHFDVDVSALAHVGDHITVGSIKLPESAEWITDPEEAIVSVKEQKQEKEEAPVAAEEAPAVDGEEEKKEESSE